MQFLALASAKVLTGCSGDDPVFPSTTGAGGAGGTGGTGGGGGKDVIVVGGGLAGLCAAHELKKKGYNIVGILEAQKRTGGRVQTLRGGWKNGQYAELGATRIADSHNYTLQYVDEFSLTLKIREGDFTGVQLHGDVFGIAVTGYFPHTT